MEAKSETKKEVFNGPQAVAVLLLILLFAALLAYDPKCGLTFVCGLMIGAFQYSSDPFRRVATFVLVGFIFAIVAFV